MLLKVECPATYHIAIGKDAHPILSSLQHLGHIPIGGHGNFLAGIFYRLPHGSLQATVLVIEVSAATERIAARVGDTDIDCPDTIGSRHILRDGEVNLYLSAILEFLGCLITLVEQ